MCSSLTATIIITKNAEQPFLTQLYVFFHIYTSSYPFYILTKMVVILNLIQLKTSHKVGTLTHLVAFIN